jgi:hypothetical protein
MFSNVVVKIVSSCGVYCVPCTHYTPQFETLYHNVAEHLMTYVYYFDKTVTLARFSIGSPDDGPGGLKHVGAIMRYFNCAF